MKSSPAKRSSKTRTLQVGLIGCGNISNAYFKGLKPYEEWIRIVSCADLDPARARARADEHGVPTSCSMEELLASPVDIVLNLTTPQAHAPVNLAALRAGKHVYCEKPFSLSTKEGAKVMAEAKKRGLRVGCAPDTVLGAGVQTARKLIDDGAIGRPISFVANMLCRGHESWHPAPEFYYQQGGGPLFDMGPYYLSSLVTFLGPIKSVTAMAATTFKTRLITSQPKHGKKIKVETPTHLTGAVEFVGGALGTVTMSFDVHAHHLPNLEIFGTESSLSCPDPNHFSGDVRLWKPEQKEWGSAPLTHNPHTGRGFGLAEMGHAILRRRPHRVNGEIGLHVVEVIEAFHRSAVSGRKVTLKTTCRQPVALRPNLALGQVE